MVTKCYVSSKPKDCGNCKFWRIKKMDCVLGKQNCRYLISLAMEDISNGNCRSCTSCMSKFQVVMVDDI